LTYYTYIQLFSSYPHFVLHVVNRETLILLIIILSIRYNKS